MLWVAALWLQVSTWQAAVAQLLCRDILCAHHCGLDNKVVYVIKPQQMRLFHPSAGGGLDAAAPKQFTYCREQLAAYADPQHGAYWREVELAAADAMEIFGFDGPNLRSSRRHHTPSKGNKQLRGRAVEQQLPAKQQPVLRLQHGSSKQLMKVHSYVQTAGADQSPQGAGNPNHQRQQRQPPTTGHLGGSVLVAAAEASLMRRQLLEPPTPDKSQVVMFDIDETVLSNMQQILNPEEWPWDKWVQAAQAPPLQPVQQFYEALCAAGLSVAFVTGRREAARERTMHNLEAAGYGTVCAGQVGSGHDITDSSSTGTTSGSSSSTKCCYAALYMRPENDTRLASVYKPWARRQLLDSYNLQLVALVGDQFSDLNGDVSAPYAFKMPNPFYYIL